MNIPDFLDADADGFVHVTGRRVGLQHLVQYYNEGYSPETLAAEYPTLSLASIHKVIAYYLTWITDAKWMTTWQLARGRPICSEPRPNAVRHWRNCGNESNK